MATNYPGALDAFTNPTTADALNSVTVPHDQQHANANDAIKAIETELGINPKGSAASVKARLDGINPAAGQVQGTSRGFFGASALAQTAVATNPMVIAKDTGAAYVQVAAINAASTGSADFAAYGDNGTDTAGWVDMGFTGSGFNDTSYTITNANDGYVFASATNSGFTGNLVLATSGNGSANDIVLATGGFLAANEKARLQGSTGKFTAKALAAGAGTATLAPLQLTAGTNLTTPAAGAIEFDGSTFYGTIAASSGRAVLDTVAYIAPSTTTATTNVATAQSMFGKSYTLQPNTTYQFEVLCKFTKATTTTCTVGFSMAASVALSSFYCHGVGALTAANASGAAQTGFSIANATNTPLTATGTTATGQFRVTGILRTGATAGTITPQLQYSAAPGGAGTVDVGSFMMIRNLGTTTATQVGAWA